MTLLHPREDTLLRYAAGSAAESLRRRVANHLASCDRCRRVVTSTRDLRSSLASADVVAAPDALFTRIMASRASGARVLLPVEAPEARGGKQGARPALWLALAGAAVIAVVSVMPKLWVPSATDTSAVKLTAKGQSLPPERDTSIPAAGPINPARMHAVTLRYGMVEFLGASPASSGQSFSYRFVRSGPAGREWLLISQFDMGGEGRRPDSIWIDATTLEPTRWGQRGVPHVSYTREDGMLRVTRTAVPPSPRARYGPIDTSYQMPALDLPIAQDRAHFVALMMTMPLAQNWRGRFARLFVERKGVTAFPTEAIQITGSRTVITGAGKFDCWEAAERRPDGYQVRWFRKSDGLYVGEEAATAEPSFTLSRPRYHFKVLLVSEE